MNQRRSQLILVALLLAALLGSAALILKKDPTLGLDLQGGLEVTLRAVPPPGQDLTEEDLDRSVSIMRNRVDKLGVAEPEIRKQGSNQIVIDLPGVKNPEKAAEVIGQTAQLEFFDLEGDLTGPSISRNTPVATPNLHDLLVRQQALVKPDKTTEWYLFKGKRKVGEADSREDLLRPHDGRVPKGHKVLGVPPGTVVAECGIGEEVCPGVNEFPPRQNYFYLFKYQPNHPTNPIPEMTGEDLKLTGTRQDFDTRTNEPVVLMQFTGEGREKFHDITRELAQRGRTQTNFAGGGEPLLQHFAIVLDREIKSWPSIDFEELPNGISGESGAQITGVGNITEAKNLALVLQTGALPVEFETQEQTAISATLGKDSLEQAWKAALGGMLIVALFLIVFYRFLGLVAVLGLGVYAAFLYAAILIFNVTLTLPGFAGMILTIGVAADANVVIFERIKEESRAGKSVRAAIAAGYGKGFNTIIDANVVTAITALVLFLIATAGVKGFALMLLIGTGMSLITAVAATRAMLGLLAGFRWFDSPRFMGASGEQTAKWLQIDFMGKRRLWFAISGAVVAVSLGALAVKGLNLGIDFRGGSQVTFKTDRPVELGAVRAQADRVGEADAVIQGRGSAVAGDRYRQFHVRAKSLTNEEQDRLQEGLRSAVGANSFAVKNVSASFGRQIAQNALLAILFSLLLIVIYITLRFPGWKFAVPVMGALVHDVLVTIGIYALTGREITAATVAAVLTVLGYSMYDTIIIFDRIRENLPLMRRSSFASISNVSIWETIRRSLATTFITLLPVGALLLFGGETLKDFAFALLIGIASGSYSTIFIASPLVTILKEREPEWARLKGQIVPSDGGPEPDDGGTPARRRPVRPGGGPAVTDPGTLALESATQAAAAQPTPTLGGLTPQPAGSADAKRERRRQRRRTRPHGRAR